MEMIQDTAYNFLQTFKACQDTFCSNKPRRVRRNRMWVPPKLGEYKINFDAAMFNESEKVGIGVVVCDSSG